MGCGPIGLGVILALREIGAGPVIASDHRPMRRRIAELLGADAVHDPRETSPFADWVEYGAVSTPPAPLLDSSFGSGPAVIFDCVGRPGTLQAIFEAAVAGTHIVVVGACVVPDTIVPVIGLAKTLSLDFVFGYTPSEFALSLERIANGEIDASPLITSLVASEDTDVIASRLRSKDEVKVVVQW